jgi:hypothetical protein
MKNTTWFYETENFDGTGEKVYYCHIPVDDSPIPSLMVLCHFPSEKRAWFWKMFSDEVFRVKCDSWEDAENLKRILNSGRKNHLMKEMALEDAVERDMDRY